MDGRKQAINEETEEEGKERKLGKGKEGKRKRKKLMYSWVYLLIELGMGHFSVSLREDPWI